MPSFSLPSEYIRRISERFKRYRKIRSLIAKNVDSYIADYKNFHGTKEERSEYLEAKYRPKAPQENYLAVMAGGNVRFHVKDIALLTGRDPSSVSRLLANLERSEGWYSRLVSLRHKAKSANNNTIYVYDRKIFGLIMDYREHMYLERIKRAGAVDFTEIMRLWEYLKKFDGCENSVPSENIISRFQNDNDDSQQELPDIPPASWKDVLHIIGSRLFSVKADVNVPSLKLESFGEVWYSALRLDTHITAPEYPYSPGLVYFQPLSGRTLKAHPLTCLFIGNFYAIRKSHRLHVSLNSSKTVVYLSVPVAERPFIYVFVF